MLSQNEYIEKIYSEAASMARKRLFESFPDCDIKTVHNNIRIATSSSIKYNTIMRFYDLYIEQSLTVILYSLQRKEGASC